MCSRGESDERLRSAPEQFWVKVNDRDRLDKAPRGDSGTHTGFDKNGLQTVGTHEQAPELMVGSKSKFLASMDIYASAICGVEILNKGNLPWPSLDDDAVRRIVLSTFVNYFILSTKL
jgi:hypothetical protein